MFKIWGILLEILFPSKRVERRVREMNLEDFVLIKESYFDYEKNILSIFKYKNPTVREAIKQLKYKRSGRMAKIFAEMIYAEILEDVSDISLFENLEKAYLVPIPMSKKERSGRGYNQVELVLEEILKIDGENFIFDKTLLKKVKENKRQTELNKEERIKNVKRVFSADKSVKDKNIILIDDVYTTGATIEEARKILFGVGAKKILCVVVAR